MERECGEFERARPDPWTLNLGPLFSFAQKKTMLFFSQLGTSIWLKSNKRNSYGLFASFEAKGHGFSERSVQCASARNIWALAVGAGSVRIV